MFSCVFMSWVVGNNRDTGSVFAIEIGLADNLECIRGRLHESILQRVTNQPAVEAYSKALVFDKHFPFPTDVLMTSTDGVDGKH